MEKTVEEKESERKGEIERQKRAKESQGKSYRRKTNE